MGRDYCYICNVSIRILNEPGAIVCDCLQCYCSICSRILLRDKIDFITHNDEKLLLRNINNHTTNFVKKCLDCDSGFSSPTPIFDFLKIKYS
jgi:hypothetical protein